MDQCLFIAPYNRTAPDPRADARHVTVATFVDDMADAPVTASIRANGELQP